MNSEKKYRPLNLIPADFFISLLLLVFFLLPLDNPLKSQDVALKTRISLPRQTSTVYSLLNQISEESGFFFIYDSQLVDNNRKVSIRRSNNKEMKLLLDEILDDSSLNYRIIQNHILIHRKEDQVELAAAGQKEENNADSFFTVKGRVLDQASGEPLPYASVGVAGKPIGISTNTDGYFQLHLPARLIENDLQVSYMGYRSKNMPLELLKGTTMEIMLEADFISMQEVIIRYYDPVKIIREAMDKKRENYSQHPVYLYSFYREGVKRSRKVINYSEAVFKIYKTPYSDYSGKDQVVMLKARNIIDNNNTDTLFLKLKAGVQSSLQLDIVKNTPEFLDEEFIDIYEFYNAGILYRNNRSVYAIEFKQPEQLKAPLFRGVLYIDQESAAIVEAEFEVNPRYINMAKDQFFVGRYPGYITGIEKAKYYINYREINGKYYLNHVRGDLTMKIRKRKQLFSNKYDVFLEMAVFNIDDNNVERFPRRETLKTNTVFLEQGYNYDDSFWENFNIITPETHINEAISKMQPMIESFIDKQSE